MDAFIVHETTAGLALKPFFSIEIEITKASSVM